MSPATRYEVPHPLASNLDRRIVFASRVADHSVSLHPKVTLQLGYSGDWHRLKANLVAGNLCLPLFHNLGHLALGVASSPTPAVSDNVS